MPRNAELILDGHGGWNVHEAPAYAVVPKGTTIHFYTENFKLLMQADLDDRTAADEALDQFRNTTPNQSGQEYLTVPNYTLYPIDYTGTPPWFVYNVSSATPLCTDADGTLCEGGVHSCQGVFADDDVVGAVLYWGACRYVELEEVGTEEYYDETGVNQVQDEWGDQNPTVGWSREP